MFEVNNSLFDRLKKSIKDHEKIVFLVGSGISKSAGIPTGPEIVDILKKEFHLDPNKNYTYSEAFEAALPGPENRGRRRAFIEDLCAGKKPQFEHHALIHLMQKGIISAIVTTNFDHLLEGAATFYGKNAPLIYSHDVEMDPVESISSYPKIIKIHGDFLYDNIANLEEEEEARLNSNMRNRIANNMKGNHLVVLGYSGSDRTVMRFIEETALSPENNIAGIHWVYRKNKNSNHGKLLRALSSKLVIKNIFEYAPTTNASEFLKAFSSEFGIEIRPVKFGIQEREGLEFINTFPHFVKRPLQSPPKLKKLLDVNDWIIDLKSHRVNIIQAGENDYVTSILGSIAIKLGPESALYIDLRFCESPVDITLLSYLEDFSTKIAQDFKGSLTSNIRSIFSRGGVIAIDGLDSFLEVGELHSAIYSIIDAAKEAGNGSVILALKEGLSSLSQLYQFQYLNKGPTLFIPNPQLMDKTLPSISNVISNSSQRALSKFYLLRFAEPYELINKADIKLTKKELTEFSKQGILIERDGLYYMNYPVSSVSNSERDLLKIALAYRKLSESRTRRQLHNYLEAEYFYYRAKAFDRGLEMLLAAWSTFRGLVAWFHRTLKDYVNLILRNELSIDGFTPMQLIALGEMYHATHVVTGTVIGDPEEICDRLEDQISASLKKMHPNIAEGCIVALEGAKAAHSSGDPYAFRKFKQATELLRNQGASEVLGYSSMWASAIGPIQHRKEYTLLASKVYEKIGMPVESAYALDNYASALITSGNFSSAIKTEIRARKFYSKYEGYSEGKAAANGNLFLSYLGERKFEEAEGYFYESNLNCIATGQYGWILNHLLSLFLLTLQEKNLPSLWPTKHAIYKAGKETMLTIITKYREQLRSQEHVMLFTLHFDDCFDRNDSEGCMEVIHDLEELNTFTATNTFDCILNLKIRYRSKFGN